ncbi:MAG: DUF6320 domain-containing protein [Clostridiales bacterium]|nr:DUF6320 domain-containing protein [Clostridiales bacterium]
MGKCLNCGVYINDPVSICPLCKCIVEQEGEQDKMLYPFLDAEKVIKKMQLALNFYLFGAIATELILLVIKLMTDAANFYWLMLLVGAFLVYGFITLKVSIQMHTGYRFKMFLQALLGWAVLFVIDLFSGWGGWSLNYIWPAVCILMDAAILVLMLVNSRNWQSYIPLQLFIIAFCVLPFVLYHFGLVTNMLMGLIAMLVAILMFVGTMIVGGRRARTELYRRFHV